MPQRCWNKGRLVYTSSRRYLCRKTDTTIWISLNTNTLNLFIRLYCFIYKQILWRYRNTIMNNKCLWFFSVEVRLELWFILVLYNIIYIILTQSNSFANLTWTVSLCSNTEWLLNITFVHEINSSRNVMSYCYLRNVKK